MGFTEIYLRPKGHPEDQPVDLIKLTFRGERLIGNTEDAAFELLTALSNYHEASGGNGLELEAWIEREDDD